MTQKVTDRTPDRLQGLTDEHAKCAGWVLATIAKLYRTERSSAPVDGLDFAVRVGAKSYELVGHSCHGGARAVSRSARAALGEIPDGIARGELAERLDEAARSLGCEWGADGPLVPSIPGPRRSGESGRVPASRPERAVTAR
ncbi:hypothetical protein ABT255_03065 [Streptomyces mirabilis]|uniref:hypothetical protein n=1 Tax=Streptomyces mirabilis TaxID=68239 RepID=UPI003328F7D7